MNHEFDNEALGTSAILAYVAGVTAILGTAAIGIGFMVRLGWEAAGRLLG